MRQIARFFRPTMVLGTAFTVLFTFGVAANAENWRQWRGPRNDGTSTETGLPTTWSATENVVWKLPLPGPAGATPVVWGDRIFLTSAKGQDLVLICADTSGKLLWERKLGTGDETVRGDEGNSASPSPSTDGKHVWAMLSTGELGCYDFDGNQVWQFNLQERYGKFSIQFGMTSTPVLDGDKLYIQLLHTNYYLLAAIDKLTGKDLWKHERQSDAKAECEHSYASPVLYRDGKNEFLLAHGCDYVTAHSLKDGAELFRCGGLNPEGKYNMTLRFVASPVAAEGLIVVPSAKNGPVLGLSVNAKGDITKSSAGHFWRRDDNTPDVPSPLVHDGLVYLCRENGILICLDARTGEQLYYERTHSQRHRASPVYADGKVYLTARDGMVTVVKAGRKFEVLASNDIGEAISASPVISGGRIYLRTYDSLIAIGTK
jgi:outer membrane protein assembly factor BamB